MTQIIHYYFFLYFPSSSLHLRLNLYIYTRKKYNGLKKGGIEWLSERFKIVFGNFLVIQNSDILAHWNTMSQICKISYTTVALDQPVACSFTFRSSWKVPIVSIFQSLTWIGRKTNPHLPTNTVQTAGIEHANALWFFVQMLMWNSIAQFIVKIKEIKYKVSYLSYRCPNMFNSKTMKYFIELNLNKSLTC